MIKHLACVMDGNRRWAAKHGQLSWYGHRAGAKTVEVAIAFCLKHKISYLSLYTFSLENFKRTAEEKSYIFELLVQQAHVYIPKFIQSGIKICFVGDLQKFPENVQHVCMQLQEHTAHGTELQVNFLFGYGARQEIFAAAKSFAEHYAQGKDITQDFFESLFWSAGIPDPDLIIRTGGVQRLSNFLLYQSAYTEIRFLETLWPDLTEAEIEASVMSALVAQKNLGK